MCAWIALCLPVAVLLGATIVGEILDEQKAGPRTRDQERVYFLGLACLMLAIPAIAGWVGAAASLLGVRRGRPQLGTRATLILNAIPALLWTGLIVAGFQTDVSEPFYHAATVSLPSGGTEQVERACVRRTRRWWSVPLSEKTGYLDRSGDFVIPAKFDEGWGFRGDRAVVGVGGRYGVIDAAGRWIAEPQFDRTEPYYSEGYLSVEANAGWGFLNRDGELAIRPIYAGARHFCEGLAAVEMEGRWGFINAGGDFVVEPQFLKVRCFGRERAPVFIDGAWGFIDPTGQMVIPPQFDEVQGWSKQGNLVAVLDGQQREIDLDGNFVDEPDQP